MTNKMAALDEFITEQCKLLEDEFQQEFDFEGWDNINWDAEQADD